MPENVDTLYLYGKGLAGTGNNQNDSIFGDGVYSNTLIAGSGNDYIVGGSGGNTLVAGTGIDTMYGGTGANIFVFGPGDAPVNNPNGTTISVISSLAPTSSISPLFTRAATNSPSSVRRRSPAPAKSTILRSGGYTFVEGDVTSPGGADFEIECPAASPCKPPTSALSSAPGHLAGTRILTRKRSAGGKLVDRRSRGHP